MALCAASGIPHWKNPIHHTPRTPAQGSTALARTARMKRSRGIVAAAGRLRSSQLLHTFGKHTGGTTQGMSIFRYNSRHKAITLAGVALAAAAGFYLNQREQPTYDNGQPKRTGSVENGRNQGRWTWYYPNGSKKMEGDFEGGKRNGRWLTFAPNGDTLTVSFYLNDRLNGPHTEYGADGLPAMVTTYTDDRPVGPAAPVAR